MAKPKDKLLESLTEEQKKIILDNFETMDINSLSRFVWQDERADQRSLRGKAVKEFLALQGAAFKPVSKFKNGGPIELTDEQKEFIETNLNNGLKSLQITRLLFQNPNLSPVCREFRCVYSHIQSLNPDFLDKNEEVVDVKEYKPPQAIHHLTARVNEYLPLGGVGVLYNYNALKTYEEKCLKQLWSYLKAPNFIYQASQYEKKVDRDLFEGSFIRFCHDKPDLTAEEIHQYISLASEIVNTAQIERTIQKLDSEINSWLNGEDEDKKKMSMSMVELINAARGKWEGSKERQKKLLSELTEARSTRLKNRLDQNASILNLVEAFQKEKERKELIEIAELEKKADMIETDKLSNMDQVVALIAGMAIKEFHR